MCAQEIFTITALMPSDANDCNLSVIWGPVEWEVGPRPQFSPWFLQLEPIMDLVPAAPQGTNLLHCPFSLLAPDCTVKNREKHTLCSLVSSEHKEDCRGFSRPWHFKSSWFPLPAQPATIQTTLCTNITFSELTEECNIYIMFIDTFVCVRVSVTVCVFVLASVQATGLLILKTFNF